MKNWKMIWIIGKMGAGKTTLCLKLKDHLPDFNHLNIDLYRIKYGAGNESSKAEVSFYKALEETSNILLESVGTWGQCSTHYIEKNCLIIYLDIETDVSYKRAVERTKSLSYTPVPGWSDDPEEIHRLMLSLDDRFSYIKNIAHYQVNARQNSEEVLSEVLSILKKEDIIS